MVLAELGRRQHGVVSLAQLAALGLSSRTIGRWVAGGRLIRIHAGVFGPGPAQLSARGQWMAAVLACGPGAALSHRSAAALHGIRNSAAGVVEVSAPVHRGRSRPGLRVHSAARLAAEDVVTRNAIPCTTVSRTVLDLAAVLDPPRLARACEAAERLRVVDLRAVTVLIGRHRGRRGVARLREVIAEFDPEAARVRSELEALFWHLCVDHGLPRPLVNRRVEVGAAVFEVDFRWPAQHLVVETDGHEFHRTVAARRRDAERDRALRGSGWTLLRRDWQAVVHAPEATVAELRALCARRVADFGRR